MNKIAYCNDHLDLNFEKQFEDNNKIKRAIDTEPDNYTYTLWGPRKREHPWKFRF